MAMPMAVNVAVAVAVLAAGVLSGCAPVKETAATPATVDAYVASLKETAAPWDKRRVGLRPFTTPRIKVLVERSLWDSSRTRTDIRKAVAEINAALPADRALTVEPCTEVTCRVSGHGHLAPVHEGGVAVFSGLCATTNVSGCASNDRRNRAHVKLTPRWAKENAPLRRRAIIHELVHALGVHGHSSAARFPRSIMAVHAKRVRGEVRGTSTSRLGPVDIAVLQRMYPPRVVQSGDGLQAKEQ